MAHIDRTRLPEPAAYFAAALNVDSVTQKKRYPCPGCKAAHSLSIGNGLFRCHACEAGGGVLDFEVLRAGGDPKRRGDLHAAACALGALVEADEEKETAEQRQARERRQIEQRAAHEADRARQEAKDQAEQRSKLVTIANILRRRRPVKSEPSSPAARYLVETRCVVLPPDDGDLGWIEHLRFADFDGPVLIGRGTLIGDPSVTSCIHLTGLVFDGQQWQRTGRIYYGPKKGTVVRLWPDDQVTMGLGIAEGIETALSLAHGFTPVWACLDAGNLGTFPVLPGIEALTIAADNDKAGRDASQACAARWHAAGAEVRIVMPPDPGADLNDMARPT